MEHDEARDDLHGASHLESEPTIGEEGKLVIGRAKEALARIKAGAVFARLGRRSGAPPTR
jgi:hypothetical protein